MPSLELLLDWRTFTVFDWMALLAVAMALLSLLVSIFAFFFDWW